MFRLLILKEDRIDYSGQGISTYNSAPELHTIYSIIITHCARDPADVIYVESWSLTEACSYNCSLTHFTKCYDYLYIYPAENNYD